MREHEIKEFIVDELKSYFHIMSEEEILRSIQNYASVKDLPDRARRMAQRRPPPTDYNKEIIDKLGTRQKAMKTITKNVQSRVVAKFRITREKRIQQTGFLIDLFDEEEKICYEISLGNGTEVFKDIIKALMTDAKKLVIFSRSYPNPWGMIGYGYIKRHWEAMKNKIRLEVEVLEFMSSRSADSPSNNR